VLNQDFKEFVQSLNDSGVRHLVIGGCAVALHGYPRYTKDVGIWIEMTPGNAAKMIAALEQFGFGTLGLQAADFSVPDQVIQLAYPPSHIDLISTPPGVDFEPCYASRVEAVIDSVTYASSTWRVSGRANGRRAASSTSRTAPSCLSR
jgi:hypothetical protein